MVTLTLDAADLARTRFAFSPLWESVIAFRLWRSPGPRDHLRPWDRTFRAVAPGEMWPCLSAIALAPSGAIPDFLAPPPPRPFAEFEEELSGLRQTPWAVVVSELRNAYGGRLPQGTPRRPSDLGRFLDNVSRELALFWRWAVAPLWTRLRGCLDAEVVYRSRVLAFGGAAALFENLHHAIEFTPRRSGGILRVRSRQQINRRGGGAGLVLVPSVFCWPDAYVVAREPWRPTVAYPARGVADVWDPAAADSPFLTRALEALIGTARARVLQGLARNPTTTGLAAALRMSPSTVSTHLARLHDAGVLTRTRVGHKVLYAANQRGLELLRQYDGSSGLAPGGKLGLLRQR